MKALIFNTTICQIVEDKDVFDVHGDLRWVDCSEEVTTEWTFQDGIFKEPTKVELPYDIQRRFEYPDISQQLDILYHEGYDGWKATVKAIKDKYPKPE